MESLCINRAGCMGVASSPFLLSTGWSEKDQDFFFPWKEAGSLTIHPGVQLGIRQWWDYWHHVPTCWPLLPLSGAISLIVGECSSLKTEVFIVCLSLKPFRPEIFQNKFA